MKTDKIKFFPLISSLDRPYTKGILNDSYWERPRGQTPALRELACKLPIELAYYTHFPTIGYALTIEDICRLYLDHTKLLEELLRSKKINKKQKSVTQDVLDRFFLNIYIRAKDNTEANEYLLQTLQETIIKRWEKTFSKIIKNYTTNVNKEAYEDLLSDAAIYICEQLKQITGKNFIGMQSHKWDLQTTRLLNRETGSPPLKVFPIFIGNLLAKLRYSRSSSIYANHFSNNEDGEEEEFPGSQIILGDNSVEEIRCDGPTLKFKKKSKVKYYPLKIVLKHEITSGLKNPTTGLWIIPPKPAKTPYNHISRVAKAYGLSERHIRRYVKNGFVEGNYFRIKAHGGKLLYIKGDSQPALVHRQNFKSWIKGIGKYNNLCNKRASNYINYLVKKGIRTKDFFTKIHFTQKDYLKIMNEYSVGKYMRKADKTRSLLTKRTP